jgi:C4-dicarboxylate-specific signal transduction histidine kinase
MNAPAIKSSTGKNRTVDAKPLTKVGSVLTRKRFVTSRLADFADPKKLAVQIGHGPSWWPDVILKELVDNALDAAEGAGVGPKIAITITGTSISVSDNGGGMPTKAVKQILNYATKASTNAAHVSPTRVSRAMHCRRCSQWATP